MSRVRWTMHNAGSPSGGARRDGDAAPHAGLGQRSRRMHGSGEPAIRLFRNEIRGVLGKPRLAALGAVSGEFARAGAVPVSSQPAGEIDGRKMQRLLGRIQFTDRKSTRLNSSHLVISY